MASLPTVREDPASPTHVPEAEEHTSMLDDGAAAHQRQPSGKGALPRLLVQIRDLVAPDSRPRELLHRLCPALLAVALAGYILFGAGAFYLLERGEVERAYRRHSEKMFTLRRNVARETAHRIFNDTKNLFVVMDVEQSSRVQAHLVYSLREYEKQLALRKPQRTDWTWWSSLAYAWSLLTTLGSSTLSPRTLKGQVFALVYAAFGVPLFVLALLTAGHRILLFAERKGPLERRRRVRLLGATIGTFVAFIFATAVFLVYANVNDTVWPHAVPLALSTLTIHTPEYTNLSDTNKLYVLAATTIALYIIEFGGYLIYCLYVQCRASAASGDAPRFQVIVNETGETKLQTTPLATT